MFQFKNSEPQPWDIQGEIQTIRESLIPVAGRLSLLRPVLPHAGQHWAPTSEGGVSQRKAESAKLLIVEALRYLRVASETLQQAHDELTSDDED